MRSCHRAAHFSDRRIIVPAILVSRPDRATQLRIEEVGLTFRSRRLGDRVPRASLKRSANGSLLPTIRANSARGSPWPSRPVAPELIWRRFTGSFIIVPDQVGQSRYDLPVRKIRYLQRISSGAETPSKASPDASTVSIPRTKAKRAPVNLLLSSLMKRKCGMSLPRLYCACSSLASSYK